MHLDRDSAVVQWQLQVGRSRNRIPGWPRFSMPIHSDLGPTQTPVQWVPDPFRGGKAARAWRWPSTPSSTMVRERVGRYLYSPSGPSWPVLNHGARYRWVPPCPGRLTRGKEIPYQLYRRLGGPQGWSGHLWKIFPQPGFDPRTVHPLDSRRTYCAVPAHRWWWWWWWGKVCLSKMRSHQALVSHSILCLKQLA